MHKQLAPEIDSMAPDYSLYPDCDYDLGFTTRGCIRNCPFCIVREKEGSFRIYKHPSEFHNPDHKGIVLMDNNILADKDWFFVVTNWILENDLKVDFNQGLDIRLVDEEIAERIKQLKPLNYWRFAFDSLSYENSVRKGIELLNKAGVNLRSKSLWYVYTDGDSDFDNALKRCEILRSLGVMPYPMFNRHAKRTQRLTNLKRWCRPWIFFKVDWSEYQQNNTRQKGTGIGTTPLVQNSGISTGGLPLD